MALSFFTSPIQVSVAELYPASYAPQGIHAKMPRQNVFSASAQTVEPTVLRRSGNYKPNFWDHEFLMSLDSRYKEDAYKIKADQLKEKVWNVFSTQVGSDDILHLIDAIQRLGVGYHYKEEIRKALDNIYVNQNRWIHDDLYIASLRFRLLSKHGYTVSEDIFRRFKDENGSLKLKPCQCEDVKGVLSLYEASYYGLPGEDFLEEAKALTTKILIAEKQNTDAILAKKISHSLEMPLHRRTFKLESMWYIDAYESEENMIPVLLDLAKLDFNIVQASYQSEVVSLTRWWVELGLNKMDFFRDRILEHYFWSLGMVPEPQFGRFRVDLAKATTLITVIDDIYDVYGTLEELVLFTDAVERWEVSAMDQLPLYMKICYPSSNPILCSMVLPIGSPLWQNHLGTKPFTCLQSVQSHLVFVPSIFEGKGEYVGPPEVYPGSSAAKTKPFEQRDQQYVLTEIDGVISTIQRVYTSFKNADALCFRACHEIEGPFLDYLQSQNIKPVLTIGSVLSYPSNTKLEKRWADWLGGFEKGSVVCCAFGSECVLHKDQFQELVLGLEMTGLPF